MSEGKMDPAAKKQWIEALRSGNYRQIKGVLFDYFTNAYCCLGVFLKDVHKADVATSIGMPCFPAIYGKWKEKVMSYGPSSTDVDTLASMNDNGASFTEIADWIEKNL